MPIARVFINAGPVEGDNDGTPFTRVIPTLTAGAIDQSELTIGDLVTVSGSNAGPLATYQWEQSEANVAPWSEVVGATSATLDSSSGIVGNYYVRRTVSDGKQGPVATAGILVGQIDTAPVTIDTASFTASGAGNPPSISHTLTYEGTRTLTAYGAFVDSASGDPTKEQLRSGSGAGILEAQSISVPIPSTGLELDGFTITSEAADEFHYFIEEDGLSPQSSLIEVLSTSGLDFSAATVQTAATDPTGATWTLTFDEAVYEGDTPVDTGNWTVSSTGASLTVDTVTVNGTTTVVVTVIGSIASGNTLTIDYSGGDLVDVDGNPIEDFTESVANNVAGSFAENGVVVTDGDFFTGEVMPDDRKAIFEFYSLKTAEDANRTALFSYNSVSGGTHANYLTSNGLTGARHYITGNLGTSSSEVAEPVTSGNRYHLWISSWVTGTHINSIGVVRDTVAGTTTTLWNEVGTKTASGSVINFYGNVPHIFERSTGGQNFLGTIYAMGVWTDTNGTAIVDITDPATLDEFYSGSSIKNPADFKTYVATEAPTATRHIGLWGDADSYNAGTNDGTMTLTPSGTFTDEV